VREFHFDKTLAKRNEEAREMLIAEEKTQKGRIVFWLQTAYSEVFLRWVHLKGIRAFVESVLRYGLPPDFMAAIMVPKRGQEKRLRTELAKLYEKLAGAGHATSEEEDSGPAGGEFFPYVYLSIALKK